MKLYTKFMTLCAVLIAMTAQAQFTHPLLFEVTAPSNISGSYPFGSQTSTGWGITALPSASVTGQVVWAYDITPDSLNCDTIVNNYTGKIVMIRRGACEFGLKVLQAQRSGAVGCIICNNNGGSDVINMGGGANGPLVNIPAIMLSSQNCALLNTTLANGDSLSATFRKPFISEALGFYAYETPKHHIQPLEGMSVDITNASTTNATNIVTTLRITDPSGAVTVLTENLAALDVDTTKTVTFTSTYTPVDTGTYTMSFKSSLSTDSISTNFRIGSNMFALDRNLNPAWVGITDAGFATAGYYFEFGNTYIAGPNGGAATFGTFSLQNDSIYLGKQFQVRLYELPAGINLNTATIDSLDLVGINVYTISAADTAGEYSLVTVPILDINDILIDTISMTPGAQYLLTVRYSGDSTIPQSPRFNQAGSDPLISLGTVVVTDDTYWGGFSGNPHPMIRLTTREYTPTGITNTLLETANFRVFPNPAKDVLNVDLSLQETAENATVTLFDINGRIIEQLNYSNLKQQTIQFNTGNLTAGFYFVRVKTEKGVQTKEFVKK